MSTDDDESDKEIPQLKINKIKADLLLLEMREINVLLGNDVL